VSVSAGIAVGTIFSVLGVTGGATSNAAGTAGVGSIASIVGGNGGAGTGTNAVGGAGGAINLTAGNGGTSAGTGVNSNGGNIVLTLGTAGTGGSGTAGLAGVLSVLGPSGMAGFHYLTQGSTVPTTANVQIPANSIYEYAPSSVTTYGTARAGTGPANNSMMKSYSALSSSSTTESFVQAPQKSMLTSAYTNATTGATNVTGLSFALDASTSYTGSCHLIYKAASTGGLAIDFTGPVSPTLVTYGLNYFTSATAANSAATTGAVFSTSIGGTAVATAATDFTADITFGITNGVTSGTLQLQAKSSAAVTLTIEAGSFCQMQ
jgi:hypothetical protein